MRFAFRFVSADGRPSSQKAILPGSILRMDDGDTFKLYFENDWDVSGTLRFVYDGCLYTDIEMGAETTLLYPKLFTYFRTSTGSGRLFEVSFTLHTKVKREPYTNQVMLINNDYTKEGKAVPYGYTGGDEIVEGRCTDPMKDPDLDQRVLY